jgi:hypothetical protein
MLQQSSTMDTTTESDVPTGYNGATATAEASVTISDFVSMLQSNGPVKSVGCLKGTTATAAISLAANRASEKRGSRLLSKYLLKSKRKKHLSKSLLSEVF